MTPKSPHLAHGVRGLGCVSSLHAPEIHPPSTPPPHAAMPHVPPRPEIATQSFGLAGARRMQQARAADSDAARGAQLDISIISAGRPNQ